MDEVKKKRNFTRPRKMFSPKETTYLIENARSRRGLSGVADAMNHEFHDGVVIRTEKSLKAKLISLETEGLIQLKKPNKELEAAFDMIREAFTKVSEEVADLKSLLVKLRKVREAIDLKSLLVKLRKVREAIEEFQDME